MTKEPSMIPKVETPSMGSWVYEVDKYGNKTDLVFFYHTNQLFQTARDGSIQNLVFIREGDKVFEVSKSGEKTHKVFLIEQDQHAYEVMPVGKRGRKVFTKVENLIFDTRADGNRNRVVFMLQQGECIGQLQKRVRRKPFLLK
ncbi:MAG TPA: hypothetical protein PKJ63_00615 [Cyclobacteriaceae bacterium]|nr:hypothetical protein [Cyclobacteriaceae bacterium]